MLEQMSESVVEYADLLVGKLVGVREKQIGNAPQHAVTRFARAALHRGLGVANQRCVRAHSRSPSWEKVLAPTVGGDRGCQPLALLTCGAK